MYETASVTINHRKYEFRSIDKFCDAWKAPRSKLKKKKKKKKKTKKVEKKNSGGKKKQKNKNLNKLKNNNY